MKILTASEMREVDRLTAERLGIPTSTLMENAGKSTAEFVAQRFPGFARQRILILCGKGNNGGDGLVAARHLLQLGAHPTVILLADTAELKGDAAANLGRWQDASGELRVAPDPSAWEFMKDALASAEIIVDAILGTGVRGPVEGFLRGVMEDVNRSTPRAQIVAVDIPSGLSADTGEIEGAAVTANYTITFTAPKVGFFFGKSDHCTGQLIVRDIGSPPELVDEIGKGRLYWLEPREFPQFAIRRNPSGHKGDYGHALIIAGSVGKGGAAVLAGWSASRAGAGLVTVATAEPALATIAAHTPELMTEPLAATDSGSISVHSLVGDRLDNILGGKRVLAVGPGLGLHLKRSSLFACLSASVCQFR